MLNFRRLLHTSICLRKLPPQHKLRHRRKEAPPYHEVRYVEDVPMAPAQYPVIRPKFPPGHWTSFDSPQQAWKWSQRGEHLKTFPSAFGQMREFLHLEQNLWHHPLTLPLEFPETLDFSQYITRTKLVTSPPPLNPGRNQVEVTKGLLDQLISQLRLHLSSENSRSESYIFSNNAPSLAERHRRKVAGLMECLFTVLSVQPNAPEHLRRVSIDERGTVETFIKRTGYESLGDKVNVTVRDEDGCVKYRIRGETAWQMRCRDPLPQFVDRWDHACQDGSIPQYNYHPEMFDLHPIECYSYESTPLALNQWSSEFVRTIAGYWGRTPFYEGDPCEFGLLGAVHSRRSPRLVREFASEHGNLLERHALAEGVLTSFAWTSAQAFNQGFNLYNELTYPFTTQLVLTDGHRMCIVWYQLNSLTALYKPDGAGLPFNMAWCTPEEPLFTQVTDGGEITEFNLPLLTQLAQCFLTPPRTVDDPAQLRPNLSDGPAPRQTRVFIPPGSQPELIERKPDPSLPLSRQDRTQIYGLPRPHPNDAFYFRLVEKQEVLTDIRDTFPSLARLPEPYQTRADEFRRKKIILKGRYKTVKPPSKWE